MTWRFRRDTTYAPGRQEEWGEEPLALPLPGTPQFHLQEGFAPAAVAGGGDQNLEPLPRTIGLLGADLRIVAMDGERSVQISGDTREHHPGALVLAVSLMPADSSTAPTVSTIEGEEQGTYTGEDWEDDLGPDPVSAVPAADPLPVPEAPVHPPSSRGATIFGGTPCTRFAGPPARISGHCPTTFLHPHRGAEGVRGGLPTPLVPQSVSVTPRSDQSVVELSFPEGLAHPSVPPGHICMVWGRLPTGVPFRYVLNSRVIADVVLASDSSAMAVQLADSLMRNFDCRRYTREEILDRLGLALYLRRTYESAIRRRCEEGLAQGLTPDELCRSVYRAFDRAE